MDVGTAHPSDQYLIAVALPRSSEISPAGFYTVSLADNPIKGFDTSEGADCVLSAYKFELNKAGMLEMTIYKREYGQSFADKMPVNITMYRLGNRHQLDEFGIGLTPYAFEKIKETKTQKNYCDVRQLLNQEGKL